LPLAGIPLLRGFDSLEMLEITLSAGSKADNLKNLGELPALRSLSIIPEGEFYRRASVTVKSTEGLIAQNLNNIALIALNLESADNIANFTHLKKINLSENLNLKEIPFEEFTLFELEEINFSNCKKLKNLFFISSESLKVLKKIYKNNPYLSTKNANIEHLPFKNSSFDFVCCAGGLSYGETNRVKKEIIRVLRPGGSLILIDSLDNNPIYKLNRLMHYFFGRRTFSTLKNMPTVESLNDLTKTFKSTQIYYFGALVFLLPLLNKVTSDAVSAKILNKFDKKFQIKKSAFKFVLIASELKK
jgi:SAM-dependent methyltransferase